MLSENFKNNIVLKREGIRLYNVKFTWEVIDEKIYNNRIYYLLKNECCITGDIIVDSEYNVILYEVFNGFIALEKYFYERYINSINISNTIQGRKTNE